MLVIADTRLVDCGACACLSLLCEEGVVDAVGIERAQVAARGGGTCSEWTLSEAGQAEGGTGDVCATCMCATCIETQVHKKVMDIDDRQQCSRVGHQSQEISGWQPS
jgi:hypothetical protein